MVKQAASAVVISVMQPLARRVGRRVRRVQSEGTASLLRPRVGADVAYATAFNG
jgi:hypothetical protein